MEYYSVTYEQTINASQVKVWNILANRFGEIGSISDSIKNSVYVDNIKEGIGTKRHCKLSPFGYAVETVTIWNEPNEFEFEIEETSMPMEKGGKLHFDLISLSDTQTKILVNATFRLKVVGFLSPLMKPMLLKIIKTMLSDFESHLNKERKL
ncbi:MAG: SRPBCC family protein [Fulvivirga sp.]